MSLDVYLYRELPEDTKRLSRADLAEVHEGYANWLRWHEIKPFDKWYKDGGNKIEVYNANITHNLNKMADKAGIYKALWRPFQLHKDFKPSFTDEEKDDFEEYAIVRAKEISGIIEKGLEDMKKRPDYYKQFDSPNGWGLYIHFVPFIEKYLKALKENPDAIVIVSR